MTWVPSENLKGCWGNGGDTFQRPVGGYGQGLPLRGQRQLFPLQSQAPPASQWAWARASPAHVTTCLLKPPVLYKQGASGWLPESQVWESYNLSATAHRSSNLGSHPLQPLRATAEGREERQRAQGHSCSHRDGEAAFSFKLGACSSRASGVSVSQQCEEETRAAMMGRRNSPLSASVEVTYRKEVPWS